MSYTEFEFDFPHTCGKITEVRVAIENIIEDSIRDDILNNFEKAIERSHLLNISIDSYLTYHLDELIDLDDLSDLFEEEMVKLRRLNSSMRDRAEDVINDANNKIQELEDKIDDLKYEVEALEENARDDYKEIKELKNTIEDLENIIKDLEDEQK